MTIFWDCEGVVLVDFLPRGTTISDSYYTSLLHWLHPSIREKNREKLRDGVLLFPDNVLVHKSNIIHTAIQYTGLTKLNHPAYSSDLASSDYHLFSNVKKFLRSMNFHSDNDRESLFGES